MGAINNAWEKVTETIKTTAVKVLERSRETIVDKDIWWWRSAGV